jgi:hypothetical protein
MSGLEPRDPQKIIDRYLAGENAIDIARDFGYTGSGVVLKWLRARGVEIRSMPESTKIGLRRKRSAASLYHAGT